MAVTIKNEKNKKTEAVPESLLRILPYRLADEIRRMTERNGLNVEEIRLRCERVSSLTANGKNTVMQTILTREEIDRFFKTVCEGSLYAHSDTINNGYITLDGGIRIGICGRAATVNEKIHGVYDISSMNIRIPHAVKRVGEPICRMLRSYIGCRGVLIYSPPGEGKTTLLRAVSASMAGGQMPLRVAVIDTRGELSFSLFDEGLCIDLFSGYPRGVGIEIATRTMNAQLMVCDEIGDVSEAEAIIAAQNCGVPFLASAHADSIDALLRRTGIAMLHEAHVFGCYAGIKRRGEGDFTYTFTDWEEADAILQSCGSDHNTCMRI